MQLQNDFSKIVVKYALLQIKTIIIIFIYRIFSFTDEQWANLIHQKNETIRLVEEEYVSKYKTLEEQFYTQQKSHESREIELLKTIDSLKNEVTSKDSTVDDLQNNVDTLEGGIQVLNQEIADQNEKLVKNKREADLKVRLDIYVQFHYYSLII